MPLEVAELSLETAELAADIARIGNVNALTDAAAGALMAQAAVGAAALNVKVNANGLQDKVQAQMLRERIDETGRAGRRQWSATAQETAAERGGMNAN